MLKNQDAVPEPQISVSQARVTPDELTLALAAIEARKQAEASRLAGTIPIDQAISDLHLDSTSDEIWAEVQAQRVKAAAERERQAQSQQATQQAPPKHPLGELFQRIQARRSRFTRAPRSVWRVFALVLFGSLILHNGHISLSHLSLPSLTINTHTNSTAPILRSLAQIPEGKQVYADSAAVAQISDGVPASKIFVSETAGDNRWKLIKLQGHVYLEGYIAQTNTLQSLQGKAFNVYNDSKSGDLEGVSTSNIRLRVDKTPLLKAGGDSDYSEVTVPNFQPDPLTTLSEGR